MLTTKQKLRRLAELKEKKRQERAELAAENERLHRTLETNRRRREATRRKEMMR